MEFVEGIFYSETSNKNSEKKRTENLKKILRLRATSSSMCIIYSVYLAMFFLFVEDNFGSSFYASKQKLMFPIFAQKYRVHSINL